MEVFNLADKLTEERKKNKELKIELKDNKDRCEILAYRIDKAIEYIETLEKREAYKIVDNENGVPSLVVDNEEYLVLCKYNKLLNILKGDNK